MSEEIFSVSFDSPLGPMIAGCTDRGVCLLEWHDRGGLERIGQRILKRYGCSLSDSAHPHLDQLQVELSDYFSGKRRAFTTPIDVTGTPFEKSVWNQLLAIEYGETKSYGDLATLLGKPGSSRAVGRANGANYLSIVIPCHRVIESSGELRGYGGGLWRKEWLLRLEGAWPKRESSARNKQGLTSAQLSLLPAQAARS